MKTNNIRIVDIARLANVSVGTVDRVLHNRGRVSMQKRLAVEKVLKEIDYAPNVLARLLASKKDYTLVVLLPFFKEGEYWELVYSGINKALSELKDFNINVRFIYFDQFDKNSFLKASGQLLAENVEGVVIPTLHKEQVLWLVQKLDELGIPYVFIDSDIPHCNNIAYFGCDSIVSGSIAAKLLLKEIDLDSPIVIAYSQRQKDIPSTQFENRKKGFIDYLDTNHFTGQIHFLSHDQIGDSDSPFLDKIKKQSKRIGVVAFNSRIYEVVTFFEKQELSNNVHFLGYDTIERNIHLLQTNKIDYLLSQRSVLQGYNSIKALSSYLLLGLRDNKKQYMSIDILLKENVKFYRD